MQFVTRLTAASAMVASAAAIGAVQLNKECSNSKPLARIVNRCDYPVHLWSVFKGDGCPSDEMVTLETGDMYNENLQDPKGGVTGISIKMSKTKSCSGSNIVQLEYYLEQHKAGFSFNYLDMSYVDCLGGDCPTKHEGYHLISGNQTGAYTASAGNTWCPILSCHDADSCAKISYILPDDVQTKTCDLNQSMDLYLCGSEAPSGDYSSSKPETPKPASSPKDTPSTPAYSAKPAAPYVTKAPDAKDAAHTDGKTKIEVVYVTQFQYVNAKRHVHGHARRHQPFNA